MKMKFETGGALLLVALALLGTYAFAEDSWLRHDDANATAGERDGADSIGADSGESADEEIAGGLSAAEIGDTEAAEISAERARERLREAANAAKQAGERLGNAETAAAEAGDYETMLAQIGEGLTAEQQSNLGAIMSAVAHRQAQARAQRVDLNSTAQERARVNARLNEYLKALRERVRLAARERNLTQVVARELVRRANIAAQAEDEAELDAEQVADEAAAILGTQEQAQVRDMLRERIRNNIHFWNRLLHRLRNDAQFRQHFKDWVHAQVAKQHPEIVRPEIAQPSEDVAARAIDHEFVREHLLEKIRQRLRDRAHAANQAATANNSVVAGIVQDMLAENAAISPAVVVPEDAAVAEEPDPAIVQPQ